MNNHVYIGDVLVSDLVETSAEHSGIFGMKWGIRRFQNKDGSLTEEGRLRYHGEKKYREIKVKELMDEQVKKLMAEKGIDKKEAKELMNEKEILQQVDIFVSNANAEMNKAKDKFTYAKSKIDTGRELIETSSKITDSISNLIPNVSGKSEHPDYSSISTEDLKRKTDRLNAERNYALASGELTYKKSKEEEQKERLQTIGAVLSIVGTAVGGIVLPILAHESALISGKSKGNKGG